MCVINAMNIFIIFLVVLLTFTISSRTDDISAKVWDLSTIGYYQSTTCNISLFEFIAENFDNNISNDFYNHYSKQETPHSVNGDAK